MKLEILILSVLISINQQFYSQNFPTFGSEIKVSINGLNFDAMEPFISYDGNVLFFNSLNAGGNTNLYYANRVNDSTFTYIGLIGGIYDTSANHLDGVASLDTINNFFWVSMRDYPNNMENLHKGNYQNGNITNISRVYGNFNIYSFNFPFGNLIMDAAIDYTGNFLYYCNAKFDFSNTTCVGLPCESKLGIAEKVNDTTFNKLPNTETIFSNINDTIDYLIYAPQISNNGLELYYTRLKKNTINTEICFSLRNDLNDSFSSPMVICSKLGFVPEAASPSSDNHKIYYHQKDETGRFHIFLRYRTGTTGIVDYINNNSIKVYPNPTNSIFNVVLPNSNEEFSISVYSSLGEKIYETAETKSIDISNFSNGIYVLIINQKDKSIVKKIVKAK
ncbi:MAG: T9SS type A sorting domain-containing protein [Flavobacteriia bacterium]|nr:T9SS type A sorting domain-containing protein [Flavobacteriia bacterium]